MALDRLTKVDGGGISTTSDYRVGVITASKFVGPIDGVVTGSLTGTATTAVNAQGLTGTPDIVVGILTASSANFSGNVSIGGTLTYEDVTNIDSVGIITARDGIKVSTGTATTALVVDGDARVTGILTVGTSSLKLDGPNNVVNVGTALTLGHSQGVQFHTQNLHSQGFEVNQINASGIITATGADINGDIDVDGHTNLDNVSVAGVTTFSDRVRILDNQELQLGNAGDLKIKHDSASPNNSSIINNTGFFRIANFASGQTMFIDAHTHQFRDQQSHTKAKFNENSSVELYHDGNLKFSTASSGINIVGTTTSTQLAITGISTFTGAIDANGDLDVDGHTNLDNVSIAGITTTTGNIEITKNHPAIQFNDSSDNPDYNIQNYDGKFLIYDSTNSATRLTVNTDGHIDVHGNLDARLDLDVDGHTNLDNVSIAGILTATNITSSGTVLIDTTIYSEASGDADDIIIGTTSDTQKGISIVGSTSGGIGNLYFTDGAGYKNQGRISYHHADDSMRFQTNVYERLRIDSSGRLLVGLASDPAESSIVAEGNSNSGTSYAVLDLRRGQAATSSGNVCGYIRFSDTNIDSSSRNYAWIAGMADGTSSSGADNPGRLVFATCPDNSTGLQERLRITSDGQVIVNGTDNLAHPNMDDIIVGNASGNRGITIASGSGTNFGSIAFGDSTDGSGADRYEGLIEYYHGDNSLTFYTSHTAKLRIDTDGRILTGGETGTNVSAGGIHVKTSNAGATTQALVLENNNNNANTEVQIKMVASAATPDDRYNAITCVNVAGNNRMDTVFHTCPGGTPLERMRIDNNGKVLINSATVTASYGGNLQVTNSNVAINSFANNSHAQTFMFAKSRGTSGSGGTIVQNNDFCGHIEWYADDGVDTANQIAKISARIDGGPNTNVTPGELIFYTTPDSANASTEKFAILKNGTITCGHGANTNLHQSTTTGICLNGNGNSGQIIANASGNRALIIGRQASYGQVIEFFQGTNGNEAGITIPAADTLGLETNGTERLRLKDNGSVVIYRSPSTTSGSYSTLEHMDSNAMREHVRYISAGSSSQTINLMRVRRHYWGAGFYKIWVKQVYYVATNEAVWWLNGHGRNDSGYSPSWSLGHEDKNGSIGSSFLQITSASNSSPGNDYATYVDVYATVSAYHHYIIHIEAMGSVDYSTNTSSISSNGYALF